MFQQPLANIYMASTRDEYDTIEFLKKKNNKNLITDHVLETRVSCMILLLNDLSEKKISNDEIIQKINLIRSKNTRATVMYLDINGQDPNDIDCKLDDIWFPYLHKVEIYKSNFINETRGKYISLNEREICIESISKFFESNVKVYLQKLITELDEEISNNKKGIKNGIMSIFRKSEKPEYFNYEGSIIYKVIFLFLFNFCFLLNALFFIHFIILAYAIREKNLFTFNFTILFTRL